MISWLFSFTGRIGGYIVVIVLYGTIIGLAVAFGAAFMDAQATALPPMDTTASSLGALLYALPGMLVGAALFLLWVSRQERKRGR